MKIYLPKILESRELIGPKAIFLEHKEFFQRFAMIAIGYKVCNIIDTPEELRKCMKKKEKK